MSRKSEKKKTVNPPEPETVGPDTAAAEPVPEVDAAETAAHDKAGGAEVEALKKELAELKEKMLYLQADYQNYRKREERLDRFLTGRITGGLTMLLLLTAVFWLTMTGANYPSALLYDWLFSFEEILSRAAETLHAPWWLSGVLIDGVYRVTAWIVSVMLPPMAIFFPLFTLLEDSGYLPRVAFNMDSAFKKCRACGKQCLTMAMGLGCNAAGVTGCRIASILSDFAAAV